MEQLRCNSSRSASASAVPGDASSCRGLQLPRLPHTRQVLLILYTFIVYTAESSRAFILAETLCGSELVDTLQFVCGDRGFYFGTSTYKKSTSRPNRRYKRGIVDECCFRSCDLELLETYCAKPVKKERDLSTVPVTAIPPLNKDVYHKHSHTKYSKYDIWQRKSAQRLRRGVPAIVRARHYKWQVQQIEASEQALTHRPLTSLPVTQPRPVHQGADIVHD